MFLKWNKGVGGRAPTSCAINLKNCSYVVRLLNDGFRIQVRGGCSCAGTYGHYLMHIDRNAFKRIMEESMNGCIINKPGWVRVSFHPTMTDEEVRFVCMSIKEVAAHGKKWENDYIKVGESYIHGSNEKRQKLAVDEWFQLNSEVGLLSI